MVDNAHVCNINIEKDFEGVLLFVSHWSLNQLSELIEKFSKT